MLEVNEKIENLSKKIGDIKEKQMKILELTIIIAEIKKYSMHRFNSRLEGTEERISELEGRTVEITQYEKERK